MYSDILSQIHTRDESDKLLAALGEVKKAIYEPLKHDLPTAVKENVSVNIAPLLLAKFASESPEKYIERLEAEINSLKLVTLSLAFMPTQKTVDDIFEWINSNLGVGYIVDIVVKPELLGGALIDSDGKYYDGSLGKVIDNFFRTNSNFINERI